MALWSQLKREDDIVVAVWPEYRPLYERWFVEEMVLREGKSPLWRDRYVETPDGHVKADVFEDLQAALRHVSELNRRLRADIPARLSDAIEIRSTELKADKAVQSRKRRLEEEMLMLAEARRRHTGTPRLDPSDLRLHPESEQYREEIGKVLAEMPYLRTVMIGRTNRRRIRKRANIPGSLRDLRDRPSSCLTCHPRGEDCSRARIFHNHANPGAELSEQFVCVVHDLTTP
jgi:hypothetical protein